MERRDLSNWQHDHVFGHDQTLPGERRTLIIVAVTALMMVVEVAAGVVYGSMALLADGLHMASHAAALGIAVVAYVMARRLAADPRFSFGTGKINSLAGFASAVLLGGFALVMAVESIARLIAPVAIAYDQALIVAVIGLLVNGASAWLLAATPHHHHGTEPHAHAEHEHDDDDHTHDHGHDHAHQHAHDHAHDHDRDHDHNLRAAYLHVLADALTSLLAIAALLAAKYFDARWLDPALGLLGAALVANWSLGLMREAAAVLLDHQAAPAALARLRAALADGGEDGIADLHLWDIGRGKRAAAIVIVSEAPSAPEYYRSLIPPELNVVHATIELRCPQAG
jgi:cation diffusion facilitator family transporter